MVIFSAEAMGTEDCLQTHWQNAGKPEQVLKPGNKIKFIYYYFSLGIVLFPFLNCSAYYLLKHLLLLKEYKDVYSGDLLRTKHLMG